MTATDYAAKLAELIEKYGRAELDEDYGTAGGPIVLVERSIYEDSYYVTAHATLEAAAAYHDGQEYPEDWSIKDVTDLATGTHYYAVPATSFEEMPA